MQDTVLVRQDTYNKLSTPFEPNQYVVTRRKSSMITAKECSDGRLVTKNSSFYKLLPSSAGEGQHQRREEREASDQPYDSFVFPSPPVHQEVPDSLPTTDESRDDARVPKPTPVEEKPEVTAKSILEEAETSPFTLVLKDDKSFKDKK